MPTTYRIDPARALNSLGIVYYASYFSFVDSAVMAFRPPSATLITLSGHGESWTRNAATSRRHSRTPNSR